MFGSFLQLIVFTVAISSSVRTKVGTWHRVRSEIWYSCVRTVQCGYNVYVDPRWKLKCESWNICETTTDMN